MTDESDRRQQIIEAARHVFAEHGYHKATIKRIARAAQLKSPGLIYWYFENKEALFDAALSSITPMVDAITDAPEALLEQPPEVVLPLLAQLQLTGLKQPETRRIFRIFLSELPHSPELAARLSPTGSTVVSFFQAYLQGQIERGRLRPHDPAVSARAFLGMLVIYVFNSELLPEVGGGPPEQEHYIREAVDLFLNGLRPGG